jgi:hypothetical protein
MDDDVAMEEVVKSLDLTFVACSQPADNQRRSLLHASIVSRSGAILELRRASVDARTARSAARCTPLMYRRPEGLPFVVV